MKALIITVAGMSERFSRSIGKTCLKCLYSENGVNDSLLYTLVHTCKFDKYIIVGGFMFDALENFVKTNFADLSDKIILAENKYYEEYGSGYSLYIGLQKAIEAAADQVVFAEGDLFVDAGTFKKICDSPKSVVTVNRDPILANKAVVFYFDKDNDIRYVYDTNHSMLQINEPFLGIFNSGQVWKFADKDIMQKTFYALDEEEKQGTNLVYVEKYFRAVASEDLDIMTFKSWINCNTVEDFRAKGREEQ